MKTLKPFALALMLLAMVLALSMPAGAGEMDRLSKNLKTAVKARNADKIKQALLPIVKYGGRDAVLAIAAVVATVPTNENLIYWQLINALTTLVDDDAMDALAEIVIKSRNTAFCRDVMFSMQNIRSHSAYRFYKKVLAKSPPDVQKMICEAIVNMDEPNYGIEALISVLKNTKDRDRVLRKMITDSIALLIGYDLGENIEDWIKWWDVTKDQGGIEREEKNKSGGYTGTAVDELDKYRKDKMFGPEGMKKDIKVLVIYAECHKGGRTHHVCFDRIDETTKRMNIDTDIVERVEFEKNDYKIDDKYTAVLVCCVQIHVHCVCPDCRPGTQKKDRAYP